MSVTSAAHFVDELRDLLLLRVSSSRLPAVVADVASEQPSLLLEYATSDNSHIPVVIENIIDTLSPRYPNVAVGQPILSYTDNGNNRLEVVATEVEEPLEEGEPPEEIGEGAPIPSDNSFPVSVTIGDVAFDIANYDGMTYTVLRNGEVLEGELPSLAAALGAMLGYALPEIADREAKKGAPNPDTEVDKDFLFAISKFLRKSPIIPDASVLKHLVDFVELTTQRDFNSQ
jgi:hypothetical protein